jgi:hypothetical protein
MTGVAKSLREDVTLVQIEQVTGGNFSAGCTSIC